MREKIREYFALHKDEIIQDIASLVKVKSVKGEPKDGMPFGEGPAEAIAEAQKIATRLGFKTKNFDNYVLTVNLNDDPAELGILAHLDVVPEGTGWTKQAYKLIEQDGKIYGRGVSDDKGPAVVSLWALKACVSLGIPLSKNVRIILGADEECGSSDLAYYFKKEAPPKYCVSPDASYPVYNCEKGGYRTSFRAKYTNDTAARLVYLKAGHTSNIVAQHATAGLEGVNLDEIKALCSEYAQKTKTDMTASLQGDQVVIECEGKPAHASAPQGGNNALTAILELLCKAPFEGELKKYINALNEIFPHGDYLGKAAGIAQSDEVSGALSCSFNILNICDGELVGTFDIRSPICANEDNTSNVLADRLCENGLMVDTRKMNPSHYVSEELPFIKTLLTAYEGFTGLEGGCRSMGGGTYVHHIENGVAFGPSLPGTVTNIHGADECAVVDELLLGGMIYAEVIANMCK